MTVICEIYHVLIVVRDCDCFEIFENNSQRSKFFFPADLLIFVTVLYSGIFGSSGLRMLADPTDILYSIECNVDG